MDRPFEQIVITMQDDVFCLRLQRRELDERGLEALGAEIARVIDELGCRKMVLNLGPEEPLCLYSVFLAKLVNLQRRMKNAGGAIALATLAKGTLKIFQVAGLEKYFNFHPDQESALAALRKPS